jgi:hypothetical protein
LFLDAAAAAAVVQRYLVVAVLMSNFVIDGRWKAIKNKKNYCEQQSTPRSQLREFFRFHRVMDRPKDAN